ncbi:MAG: class I SAM-dependent methyltransferase [Candidatus Binatus sp.]
MADWPLSQGEIAERLRDQDLDEWLQLWWATQGPSKRACLELMAAALPFDPDESPLVLDMCCGPGDVGRAIRSRFPKARVDCVDRDLFLLSLCMAFNRHEGIPGDTYIRDMWKADWHVGLAGNYDVVTTAYALHWFDVRRLSELFADVAQLLRRGGVFLFLEPARTEAALASLAPDEERTWERFWTRANELLGYDHSKMLGSREPTLIGDRGLPDQEWSRLLKNAGFESVDVLLKDKEKVVLAARKA